MALPEKRRGRPRNRDVDKRILETARAMLAADGYMRMTVDSVAKAAGVTRPTVYLRWPSKEELVIAAIQDLEKADQLALTGEVRNDLRTILRAVKVSFVDHGNTALMGPIMTERNHSPQLFEEFRARLVTPRRASIRAVLEKGIANGVVRADLPVDATVSALIGSLYAKIVAGENVSDDFPDEVINALWPGISAHP